MDTTEKVIGILKEISGEENVLENFSLQKDLALDSLSMVLLLVKVEDTFNIELDDTDMNPLDLTTVQDVVDLIGKYCGD